MDGVPVIEPVALRDFVTDEVPEPRWAVKDVWPEGASGIISGRPKDGKSTLAVELAVSLWSGTPMFGLERFPVQPRARDDEARECTYSSVLYVQQENSTRRVQHDVYRVLEARGLGRYVVDEYHSADDLRAAGFPADEDVLVQHFDLADLHMLGVREGRFDLVSQEGVDLSLESHKEALSALIGRHRYDYVFLDPVYMLIGAVDEKDSKELKPVLNYLSGLRDRYGCGVVLTHHMTDKAGAANDASRMLGSTYFHAWYEAAILTQRTGKAFQIKVDAVRDHGLELAHALMGRGVGHWHYDDEAQGMLDSDGRHSPAAEGKALRLSLMRELRREHPEWTDADYARELGVTSTKTIQRYRQQIEAEERLGLQVGELSSQSS